MRVADFEIVDGEVERRVFVQQNQFARQPDLLGIVDQGLAARGVFDLFGAVPTLSLPNQELVIHDRATLGLTYTEDSVRTPQPGYSFVQILEPRHVWLPNVSYEEVGVQALCLGATLPPGILIKELILLSYAALTMQTVQLDALDAGGVMNGEAAQWWKTNQHRFPLTQDSFMKPPSKQSASPLPVA